MADRIFRITITGHGGEFTFSKSSLDEYMYWNSDEAQVFVEDSTDPIMEYIMNKEYEEDIERFENVKFKREGDWYEQDDIDHTCGVNFDYAYLAVQEVTCIEWDEAEIIDTIYDYESLGEVVSENQLEVEYNDADYEGCSHVLACVSIEKGTFFEGYVTTNGEDFDIKKLKFGTKEYITEDELVEYVYYDGVQLDSEGMDTYGKGMYVHIHEV